MKKAISILLVIAVIFNTFFAFNFNVNAEENDKKYEYSSKQLQISEEFNGRKDIFLNIKFKYIEKEKSNKGMNTLSISCINYNNKVKHFNSKGVLKTYVNDKNEIIFYGTLNQKNKGKENSTLKIIHNSSTKDTYIVLNNEIPMYFGDLNQEIIEDYNYLKENNKIVFRFQYSIL